MKKEITEIKNILDSEKAVLKRIAEAKSRATEILKEGAEIPGYILQPSYGNRAWTKGTDQKLLFQNFKKWVPKVSLYSETKCISPAKLEKYFLEDESAVEILKNFTEKKYKGEVLKAV